MARAFSGENVCQDGRERSLSASRTAHRRLDADSTPIRFDSELAEPTRRALIEQSETVVGLDQCAEVVLAAYEPVGELVTVHGVTFNRLGAG